MKIGRPKGALGKKVSQARLHDLSIEVIQEAVLEVIKKINTKDLSNQEIEKLIELLKADNNYERVHG